MTRQPVTRFAPSPTGEMHLGHAFSAMVANHIGGGYILRIDDIDHTRCQDRFFNGILDDLRWLGLPWRGVPVLLRMSGTDKPKAWHSSKKGTGVRGVIGEIIDNSK